MANARWNVYVTDQGVKGCTGSFRWRWRARIQAHSNRRYWPSTTRIIEIEHGERAAYGACVLTPRNHPRDASVPRRSGSSAP